MIVVAARNTLSAQAFRERHSHHAIDIQFVIQPKSYFAFLNEIIATFSGDFVVIAHDDIWLPQNFSSNLTQLLDELETSLLSWAVVGNAGITPYKTGFAQSRQIRYLTDPHGGPNLSHHLLPAETVDGNILLLNLRKIRESGIRLPEFEGFHFYDIILSILAHEKDLAVMISPLLTCYHASGGDKQAFDQAFKRSEIFNFLKSKLYNSAILTLNGVLSFPSNIENTGFDLTAKSLANFRFNKQRNLAVIVRTEFKRLNSLLRTLLTVEAFAHTCRSGYFEVDVHVISREPIPDNFNVTANYHYIDSLNSNLVDSRTELIHWAIKNIETDFYWFVDDDDFVFPQSANEIGELLSSYPVNSLVFGNSVFFDESYLSENNDLFSEEIKVDSRSLGEDFENILQGVACIPFSGVIFPSSILKDIVRADLLPSYIVRFEDFFLQSFALNQRNVLPVVLPTELAGISYRKVPNQSIFESDRNKWNAGLSELSEAITTKFGISGLISPASSRSNYSAFQSQNYSLLNAIYSSTSWKITKPIRILKRLWTREISIHSLFQRFTIFNPKWISGIFKGFAPNRFRLIKGMLSSRINRHK